MSWVGAARKGDMACRWSTDPLSKHLAVSVTLLLTYFPGIKRIASGARSQCQNCAASCKITTHNRRTSTIVTVDLAHSCTHPYRCERDATNVNAVETAIGSVLVTPGKQPLRRLSLMCAYPPSSPCKKDVSILEKL